jgi:hypothetical protein
MANTSKQQMLSRKSPSEDLHGNARDRSPVALLLVDVINDLSFPENEPLTLREAVPCCVRTTLPLGAQARLGWAPGTLGEVE